MRHVTIPAIREFSKPYVEWMRWIDGEFYGQGTDVIIALAQEMIDQEVRNPEGVAILISRMMDSVSIEEVAAILKQYEHIYWRTDDEGELQTLPA